MMPLFPAIVALLVVGLFAWFYNYLKSLEEIGCECALDNRRVVLMFCIIAIIIGRIVAIFTKLPSSIELLFGVVGIVFFITTIWYVSHLRKVKCECSESSARTVMEYYSWIVMLLVPILIILLLPLLSMYVLYRISKNVKRPVPASRFGKLPRVRR
jgi:hypothetical protein